MSRLFQSFSRIGRDGAALSRALLAGPRGSVGYIKSVLLEQARQSNLVATSVLQIEREFGLFRYQGWRGYLQDRLIGTMRRRLFPSTQDELPNTTTAYGGGSSSPDGGAKVAFMITSSMKQELKDILGYDADRVKEMTPQQASIILFHKVSPETCDERLPILEEQFAREQEEKQRQQEQRRLLELQREQEEERKRFESFTPSLNTDPTSSASTSTTSTSTSFENTNASNPLVWSDSKEHLKLSEGTAAAIESEGTTSKLTVSLDDIPLKFRDRESGFSDIWYEVVEINPNGEQLRVGLYQEKDEALLGLKTREMIRDKRLEKAPASEPRNTFDLREISKEEAFAGS